MVNDRLLLAVLPIAALACGPVERSTPGELGYGKFVYHCVDGLSDAQCDPGIDPEAFPIAVVVGSRFELTYRANDMSTALVDTASTKMAVRDGDAFRIVAPGYAAFLAREVGQVVDLLHLRAVAVSDVRVIGPTGKRLHSLELRPGESATLQARAEDAFNHIIGGAVAYGWSPGDPALLSASKDALAGAATVVALKAGATTLSISVGSFKLDLPVTIAGNPL